MPLTHRTAAEQKAWDAAYLTALQQHGDGQLSPEGRAHLARQVADASLRERRDSIKRGISR